MRLKEFNEQVRLIESEQFIEDCVDPITYGVKRALFDQQKYERLIEAAIKTKNSRLAQSRLAKWKRLLERSRKTQERFEKLRAEARQHTKKLTAPAAAATPELQPSEAENPVLA